VRVAGLARAEGEGLADEVAEIATALRAKED
jgi:hypothetical protein